MSEEEIISYLTMYYENEENRVYEGELCKKIERNIRFI